MYANNPLEATIITFMNLLNPILSPLKTNKGLNRFSEIPIKEEKALRFFPKSKNGNAIKQQTPKKIKLEFILSIANKKLGLSPIAITTKEFETVKI